MHKLIAFSFCSSMFFSAALAENNVEKAPLFPKIEYIDSSQIEKTNPQNILTLTSVSPEDAKKQDALKEIAFMDFKEKKDTKTEQACSCIPPCSNDARHCVFLDFLFWSTNYNLPFAFKGFTSKNTTIAGPIIRTETENSFKIFRIKNKWDPGFRLGLGWNPHYDNWDFLTAWTFFHDHSKRKLTDDINKINKINFILDLAGWNAGKSSSMLTFNMFDLVVGKSYLISDKLFFRVFCGLRSGWLDQHHSAVYTGNEFATETPFNFSIDQPFRAKLKFFAWGIGPCLGLNSNWGNFSGISLLGNISTALLYGQSSLKANFDTLSADSSFFDITLDQTKTNIEERYWEQIPALQIALGLSYAKCFHENKYAFRVSAAWETNFFWESSNIVIIEKAISMQGLTLTGRFDY